MKYFLIKCNTPLKTDQFVMKDTDGFFVLVAFGLKDLEESLKACLPKGYGIPSKQTLSKKMKSWGVVEKRSIFGITMIEFKEVDEKPELKKEFDFYNKSRGKTYHLKLVENKSWKSE
jgi:hypothetical protein